jgi:hypothetical protein
MYPEVVTHNGMTLNLADIKCIKHGDYFEGKKSQMIVVFKTRYEFIKHPKTDAYIKQKFNETATFDFPDYQTAITVIREWHEIWEKYLKSQAL